MSCSRDTDGDGNCGQPACPECGPERYLPLREISPDRENSLRAEGAAAEREKIRRDLLLAIVKASHQTGPWAPELYIFATTLEKS